MSKQIKIYALVNPLTRLPFYIGATSRDLSERLGGHLTKINYKVGKTRNRRCMLILDIIKKNERPQIILLNTCDIKNVDYFESFYYNLFLSVGCDLIQDCNSFVYSGQNKDKCLDKGNSIKIPLEYVRILRENKKKTGVPIATFICQAIDEKLTRQTKA